MKGFVKILEAMIACIILISSLSFFFSSEIRPSQWSDAFLENKGYDALAALDKSGYLSDFASENNFSESSYGLNYALKKMLPDSAFFTVEIEGMPRPNINIACVCDTSEKTKLRRILSMDADADTIRFLNRSINVDITSYADTGEALGSGADVIFSFGRANFSDYPRQTRSLLDSGGGIMSILEMDQSDYDGYFAGLAKINWTAGTPSSSATFNNCSGQECVTSDIKEFFTSTGAKVETPTALSNGERQGTFYVRGSSKTFSTGFNATSYVNYSSVLYRKNQTFYSDGWAIKILDIDANYSDDGKTYAELSIRNSSYSFVMYATSGYGNIRVNNNTILRDANGLSAMQANGYSSANGNGRVVWMRNYAESYTDVNQLALASLLWVASGKYNLDKNIGNYANAPDEYSRVSYLTAGNDEFGPYSISLVMWYAY